MWYTRDDSEGIAASITHLMPPGTETSLALPVFGFDGQVSFIPPLCVVLYLMLTLLSRSHLRLSRAGKILSTHILLVQCSSLKQLLVVYWRLVSDLILYDG